MKNTKEKELQEMQALEQNLVREVDDLRRRVTFLQDQIYNEKEK